LELYLIRHTTPDILPGICYGQSDIGLAATFSSELEAIKVKLAGISPVAVYSSPAKRCSMLATQLADNWRCNPIIVDPRLKELNFGQWELQDWNNIAQEDIERWGNSFVNQAPPEGETFQELHVRAQHFLNDLRATSDQTAVAITHAGFIRALLLEAMRLPLAEAFRFELGYGKVTKFVYTSNTLEIDYFNA
jgi:alpha-ribazole phosphatase